MSNTKPARIFDPGFEVSMTASCAGKRQREQVPALETNVGFNIRRTAVIIDEYHSAIVVPEFGNGHCAEFAKDSKVGADALMPGLPQE